MSDEPETRASHDKRRLVLFLDGTWNDEEFGHSTNVVRLREALEIGVDEVLAAKGDATKPLIESAETNPRAIARGATVQGAEGEANVEYVVHYDAGVGTGMFDRLRGGALGLGLDVNVRQAYRFLSYYYRPGDEIYIFGFSRGAFTARSLVGFLYAAGLLRADECTAENEARAWAFYRTPPADRLPGEWRTLQASMNPTRVEIECLGVFDTVGALGIPLDKFRRLNRQNYGFHDTKLSSIVKRNLHAVAIDEARPPFEATLWQTPKFMHYGSLTEQVWFCGAHADVGGGYLDWGNDEHGLEEIALDWMVKRVRATTTLPLAETSPTALHPALRVADFRRALPGGSRPTIHRPWWKIDVFRSPASRLINQIPPLGAESPKQAYMRVVGQVRHADPIGEKVHISALALLKQNQVFYEGADWGERYEQPRRLAHLATYLRGVFDRGGKAKHLGQYRPPNLLAAVPAVAATYFDIAEESGERGVAETWRPYLHLNLDGRPRGAPLYVVDWEGLTIPDRENAAPGAHPSAMTWRDIFRLLPTPQELGLRPVQKSMPAPQIA